MLKLKLFGDITFKKLQFRGIFLSFFLLDIKLQNIQNFFLIWFILLFLLLLLLQKISFLLISDKGKNDLFISLNGMQVYNILKFGSPILCKLWYLLFQTELRFTLIIRRVCLWTAILMGQVQDMKIFMLRAPKNDSFQTIEVKYFIFRLIGSQIREMESLILEFNQPALYIIRDKCFQVERFDFHTELPPYLHQYAFSSLWHTAL